MLILLYASLHMKMCFIRVKSAGHCMVSGWSLTTPSWHRTVPGRASADDIIYRRRPTPVRYVTTQEKLLKKRPVPGRLSNSSVICKSLKSYVVNFICADECSGGSVVKCSSRMLIVYDCFYCDDFYLTFRCSTHNCFLDFSYECLYYCAQRWWIQANGFAGCMLLPLYRFLVKTFSSHNVLLFSF